MSKFFGWWLVCACLLFASSGSAAARSLVIVVEGADAEALRGKLVALVPSGLTVQDAAAFSRAVSPRAVKGSLGDALANPKTRRRALQGVKNALNKSDVDAVLSARIKRARGGGEAVRIVLVARGKVEPLVEKSVAYGKDEQDPLAPLLGGPLQDLAEGAANAKGSAPPAAGATGEDADEEEKPVAAATESATAKEGASTAEPDQANAPAAELASGDNAGIDRVRRPVDFGTAMFVLDTGGAIGRRSFSYKDPLRGALRNYLAPGVGMWTLGGQLYPFANSGIAVLKDVGATGNVAGALPFTSQTSDGRSSATGSWTRYAAGAHLRIRTSSRPNPAIIGVEAVYGGSSFGFSGSDAAGIALANEVPAAHYKYVRGGADLRLPLGSTPASLLAAGGFMHVLSAGRFTDRFPHASINGVDAHLGVSFAFAPWIEAKVIGEYTRLFASMRPVPGDPGEIAGGALDQFLVANVGVSAMF